MLDLRLRTAKADDLDAVRGLVERELFLPDVADFIWHRADVVGAAIAHGRYTVAERDGALVGILALEELHGELWLEVIAVEPAYRRQGVGRLLVDHAVSVAQRLGRDRVRVSTFLQYRARETYEALGFRLVDRDPYCEWLDLPVSLTR